MFDDVSKICGIRKIETDSDGFDKKNVEDEQLEQNED